MTYETTLRLPEALIRAGQPGVEVRALRADAGLDMAFTSRVTVENVVLHAIKERPGWYPRCPRCCDRSAGEVRWQPLDLRWWSRSWPSTQRRCDPLQTQNLLWNGVATAELSRGITMANGGGY